MQVNTKPTRYGQQPNYTNVCVLRTNFWTMFFGVVVSFLASQCENTLFFVVFDNANTSYSFEGCLNLVSFFGG